jgi:hypothetical protein
MNVASHVTNGKAPALSPPLLLQPSPQISTKLLAHRQQEEFLPQSLSQDAIRRFAIHS